MEGEKCIVCGDTIEDGNETDTCISCVFEAYDKEIARLKAERDELLAALEHIQKEVPYSQTKEYARYTIAKIKGAAS